MKKFINPIPSGGMPMHQDRYNDVLGPELWDSIEGMLTGLSPVAATGDAGIIISGCDVTLNGGGPNYNMTAGIVYISGKFLRHPGFSNIALPRYILPVGLVNIQKTFGDNVAKNLITDEAATDQAGVPGAQYITLSATGNYGTPGGKRLFPEKSWTALTLQNNWAQTVNTPTAGYRVNALGQVELRGQVNLGSGTNPAFSSTVVPVPVGFGGGLNCAVPIVKTSSNAAGVLLINSGTGLLSFLGTVAAADNYDLSGARWLTRY